MAGRRRFSAVALLSVAVLVSCDAERPVGLRPAEPLSSITAPSEPFFIAWSYEPFRTSPIQTQATSMNPGQYRIYTGFSATPELLSFASTYPGRLYIHGDEPDQACMAPYDYAGYYKPYVDAILAVDPTAKFSPAGLAEPNAYCCPPGDTACYNSMHSTSYAQKFYDQYIARYGVPPRVNEWRFHNLGLNPVNDYATWKSQVQAMAAWSVAHGAPMYLGSWGFLWWSQPQAQLLSHVHDAMEFLMADGRINGAAWWSYEDTSTPRYLKNSDGSLTPEGERYANGPMSIWISGPACASAWTTHEWYAVPSGGVPPYSYNWYVLGWGWWSSDNPMTYTNGDSPFTIRVDVTEKYGVVRSTTLTVPIC